MNYNLIKQFEGFSLVAYKCSRGVWTIGNGNTHYPNGEAVKEGDKISQEYADEIFYDYCNKEVKPLVDVYVWLNNNQREALSSLIYNCGGLFTKRNPSLHKALKKQDYKEIYKQWNFGISNGGGLITRRAEELSLFFRYPYK